MDFAKRQTGVGGGLNKNAFLPLMKNRMNAGERIISIVPGNSSRSLCLRV
jgi:hypothetical protein